MGIEKQKSLVVRQAGWLQSQEAWVQIQVPPRNNWTAPRRFTYPLCYILI